MRHSCLILHKRAENRVSVSTYIQHIPLESLEQSHCACGFQYNALGAISVFVICWYTSNLLRPSPLRLLCLGHTMCIIKHLEGCYIIVKDAAKLYGMQCHVNEPWQTQKKPKFFNRIITAFTQKHFCRKIIFYFRISSTLCIVAYIFKSSRHRKFFISVLDSKKKTLNWYSIN